jgi:hypothetical protein
MPAHSMSGISGHGDQRSSGDEDCAAMLGVVPGSSPESVRPRRRVPTGILVKYGIATLLSLAVHPAASLSGAEFRSDAELSGASFALIAKPDMDERGKVKAHFGMLNRARPHAPVLEAYRGRLAASLQAGLSRIAADLDIGDVEDTIRIRDGNATQFEAALTRHHRKEICTLLLTLNPMQVQRGLDQFPDGRRTGANPSALHPRVD